MSKPTYEELEQRVNELEAVEAKLRESEEKFRLAFHTNPDSINLNRVSDGLYIDINEGFTQLMGYTREEVVGKTSVELNIWVNPEDRAFLVDVLKRKGNVDNLEAKFRRKNGEISIALMSARVLRINQDNVILSITRDITKRKAMEVKLRESEFRYRTLFEKTKDAIFVVDRSTGRFLDANKAAEQLTGRPLSQLCQLKTGDVTPTEWKSRLEVVETAVVPIDFGRVTYVQPDGSERITLLSMVPLDAERIFGIAHDITEQVKLEERLFQVQKMEAIGRLAGGIAHDFNNLLVPIISYAQLGMMNVPPDENLYTHLQQIERAADGAAELTGQILAFSRRQVLELQVLNLNKIIKDFQDLTQRWLKENIEVHLCLATSLGQIKGDRAQVEQILMNLVINAGDAMPTGGRLTIETANVFLENAYFERFAEEKKPGHYVMLAVSDTGMGMDLETQKYIFEPFYTTKERGQGTGLGLATVFGIVKQHEGYIDVNSEPGKATTFNVYFPQTTEVDFLPETPQIRLASVTGSETVLVVEDEEMVRDLVCDTLTAFGYHVLEAKSVAHALQLGADHAESLDLLLTDVIMPQMNGQELYKRISAIHPHIKLLYMSGYTDNVIAHQGIKSGGINFLQKPFTVNGLAQKVREVLDH